MRTELLSIADVAEELDMTYSAAWRWIQTGQLPVVLIGKRKFVRKSELEMYLYGASE